jgi:malonyl-CoA decarboxylase
LSLPWAIISYWTPDGWAEAVNTSFFSDMLQTIADRGRALISRERREPAHERSAGLVELCDALLSGRGEASGVALAREILARYAALTIGPRIAFFETLATTFGHDRTQVEAVALG